MHYWQCSACRERTISICGTIFQSTKLPLTRGRLDASTQKTIDVIPDDAWKQYADCALAETLHSMNNTGKAFRLVVVKYLRQTELFDDQPRYHVIASNRTESTAATLVWYRNRGEVSENGIKELKIGTG